MRDVTDQVEECDPESVEIGEAQSETPEQKAWRMSFEWIHRSTNDNVRLCLELDRIKLLWLRMNARLDDLRAIAKIVQGYNEANGVELTSPLPDGLRYEKILHGLIAELELCDIYPSAPVRKSISEQLAERQRPAASVPAHAKITLYENGAWEVHPGRSELEPAGACVDYILSADLLVPSRNEIPAYAKMTEADSYE